MPPRHKPIEYRIDDNGCHICTSHSRDTNGYPTITIKGTAQHMSRYIYKKEVGPIPEGLLILHTCDNRACINPEHLFLGTQFDNMQDMSAKGRSTAKITVETMLEIRNSELPQCKLVKEYDLSPAQICRIKNRKNWNHI